MIYKTSKKGQRGQALILIALAAVGLFAFSALAIDGSRAFSNKRNAQNAADTSALTAALAYIRTPGNDAAKFAAAETKARERATSNGFDPANPGIKTKVEVYVQRCNEPTDDQTGGTLVCEGIDTAHKSEYIRVRIVSTIPATFGRVIGRETLISAAEAIVRVQGGGSTSTSWPFTGAGMVAVKNGNFDKCLMMNGGGNLYVHNSGISINCTHQDAWWMDGDSTLVMDANGKVAGCFKENGSSNWNETTDPIDCWQASHTYTEADFAGVPTTLPPPSCSGNGTVKDVSVGAQIDPSLSSPWPNPATINLKKGTATITAGTWSSIEVGTDGVLKVDPGVYCITGGITLKAGGQLINSGTSGRIQMVLGDSSFIVNGAGTNGGKVDLDDLELYFDDGSYTQNSNGATLLADRLRIFITGYGNFDVNAQGTVTSYDAYVYLPHGDIIWNSDMSLHLEAPKAPDPFAGLLVYKPWGNTSQTKINGGSNIYLVGTFLAPTSQVVYNGGSNFELHSQIIADTFIVNGNTDVDIWYVEAENYKPPSSPATTIELTK